MRVLRSFFYFFFFSLKKQYIFSNVLNYTNVSICKLFTDCNNLALTLSRGTAFPEFALLSSKFRSTWPIPVIFFALLEETSA